MSMPMSGSNGILAVSSEHLPGLIALLCVPLALGLGAKALHVAARHGSLRARQLSERLRALPLPAKAAAVAVTFGAAVHAAIVPAHWGDSRSMAILFILDTLGFMVAGWRTLTGRRHWQRLSAAVLGGTVAGYAFYLARGWETADLVGMITSAIELAGFFVVVLAGHRAFADPKRRLRLIAGSLAGALAVMAGTVAATSPATLAAASTASPHAAAMGGMGSNKSTPKASSSGSSMPGMTNDGPDGSGSAGPASGMPGMDSSGDSGAPMSSMPPATSSGASAMPGMGSDPASNSGSAPGMSGMSGGMNGSGSSGGSAGALSLPTTSPAGNITWPLPMGSMEPGMQMVTPNCTTKPTTGQQKDAVALVDQTVSAISKFQSLTAAKAAGYIPITPSGMPVVHYANPAFLANPQLLNPNAIQSLVYANTSHGAVLAAAMYTMANNQIGQTPPMPGGCLTEWHVHTNLCFSNTTHTVVGTNRSGACPPNSTNHVTQPMIHVWLAPVPGGPLAVDASGAQIVAAANALPAQSPANGTA